MRGLMSPYDLIGAPQIAALLVFVQRGLHGALLDAQTSNCLIATGTTEVGSATIPSSPPPIVAGSPA